MAERVGFEPTDRYRSLDFESSTFDHSATSPKNLLILYASINFLQMNVLFLHTTPPLLINFVTIILLDSRIYPRAQARE
jgi:hypothetical protein